MNASVSEAPGWFAIEGEQEGRRTLAEQMAGLQPALNEAIGKTVCDFGCAEGLIALEFAKVAARVRACDYNPAMIETATRLAEGVPNVEFRSADIRDILSGDGAQKKWWICDVLLALAILHKMPNPQEALEFFAEAARDLIVIRLPLGSSGDSLKSKHSHKSCNVNSTLTGRGFVLERMLVGPRRERVQYWRKRR